MSYSFYTTFHAGALFVSALSLGGLLLFHSLEKGAKERLSYLRFLLLNIHGLSLFAAVAAGFGLIAKLSISLPYPFWIYLKLAVFLALGSAPFFLEKYVSAPPPSTGDKELKAVIRPLIAFAILSALYILAAFGASYKDFV